MRKFIICVISLLASFIPFATGAQTQKNIDSLLLILSNPTLSDTSRIRTLKLLAEQYDDLDRYEDALKLATESNAKATAINHYKGRIESFLLIAEINLKQRNFTDAYDVLYETLKLSIQTSDSLSMARSYFLLGRYYRLQTILPQSMDSYIKALELYDALDDEVGQAMCFSNLGKFSSDLKDYDTALAYFNQSLAIFKKYNLLHEVYVSYQLIGDVNFRSGKFYESMKYHRLALKGGQELNDKVLIAYQCDNLGGVCVALGDFENAMRFYEQAIQVAKEINETYGLATTYNDMANMFLKLKDDEKVLTYGNLGLQYAEASANRAIIRDANLTLYKMYKQKGQWSKALEHLETVSALNDSIHNGEKTNLVNTTRYDYERRKQLSQLEKKNIELKMHQAELEAKKRLTYLYWTLGAMALLLLFMLWRRNVHKQRVNRALIERNEAIRKLNDGLETEVSMRTKELQKAVESLTKRNEDLEHFSYVLSHNVRAPIAQLKGLINILDKPNIHGELNQDIIKKIEKASCNFDIIIHDLQNILSIQNKQRQKEIVMLKDELDLVLWGLGEEVDRNKATIVQRLEVNQITTVRSAIHSVLYHLISNAIKYRAPDRDPEITVTSATENGFVTITVQDNGLGIDLKSTDPKKLFALYQRQHTHVDGKGLGLYLVKTQTEALGGFVTVSSQAGSGTVFSLSIPNR